MLSCICKSTFIKEENMKATVNLENACSCSSLAEDCHRFMEGGPCPVMGSPERTGQAKTCCPLAHLGHGCDKVTEEDWKSVVVD